MLNFTEPQILQNVEIQYIESYRKSKYKMSKIQKVEQFGVRTVQSWVWPIGPNPTFDQPPPPPIIVDLYPRIANP
jgi:hypothetical protein